jgi:putative nucleotidyltransferase with HDIG domain
MPDEVGRTEFSDLEKPEPFRIMVVDGDPQSRSSLVETLRSAGYEVTEFADAHAALDRLAQGDHDVVVADADLPVLSGVEFLAAIKARGVDVVVIMVTTGAMTLTGTECVKAGAMDFIIKPFETGDLLVRVTRAIGRRELLDERVRYKREAEARLAQSSHELRRLFLGTVESLASALEARDPNTRGHSARVADLATAMALPLRLAEEQREKLRIAGLLHDIGKIGIPDDVLKKPGRLTRRERAQIQMHPVIAVGILSPVLADPETVAIIRHHHERVDGNGYPDGIAGQEIPIGARILAAADTFDAMTSKRPYRDAYTGEQALVEMRGAAGRQLDTDVVRVFHMLLRGKSDNRNNRPANSGKNDEPPSSAAPDSDRRPVEIG